MAAKEVFLNDNSSSNSGDKSNDYSNLNLNEKRNCCSSESNDLHPSSSKIIKRVDQYNQRDSNVYHNGDKWNSDERRSMKSLESPQPSVFGSEKDKHSKNSDKFSSKTASTLSMHISSYEAAQAAVDLVYSSSDESSPHNTDKITARLQEKMRKINEQREKERIPRHQSSPPFGNSVQIMQFKADTRLFTPTTSRSYIRILSPGETFIRNRKRRHPDSTTKRNLPTVSPTTSVPPPPPPPPPSSSLPPPPPSNPSPSSANIRRSFIAPTLPKQMTTQELDDYLDEDPGIREWAQQYLTQPVKMLKPETVEEENARLRKENSALREELIAVKTENTVLKRDFRRIQAAFGNQKNRDKKRAEKSECVADPKLFETYHPASQSKIYSKIWEQLEASYGPTGAVAIVDKLHQRKVISEKQSLTPLQTLHMIKSSGITFESLRKIRSTLNNSQVHNPFASDVAVNAERAKIHDKVKLVKKTVPMIGKNGEKTATDVFQIASVEAELKDRITSLVTSDNYEPFMNDGTEEVPCVFSGDNGGGITTAVMGVGSTKNPRNSPKNCSLLGYFNATDSQANLYAAFGDPGGLAEQIDNTGDSLIGLFLESPCIKEIEIEIDGIIRKFKIRWFVLGDFKFLNAIAGLNSNSASFPCWGCEQRQENTYADLNLDEKAPERIMGINKNVSQIREPLFKTIPFDHYIPPILHITLGPGAQLFEAICERAKEMDIEKLDGQNIPDMLPSDAVRKSWHLLKENIEKLKDEIEYLNYTKSQYQVEAGEGRLVCDSTQCFALQSNIEVNNVLAIDQLCVECSSNFHKCCLNKGGCPHCTHKFPTLKQSQIVIDKECKEIQKKLKQTSKLLKEEEEKADAMIGRYKLGKLASNVESVYEKYGGSRKAFFQEFTGKQLNKMGSNIHAIYCSLDQELKDDERIRRIVRGIIQFFNIKRQLTTDILCDTEIEEIDEGIKDFAMYMKEYLPDFRVKQKGHVFFKHLPAFIKKFKIAAYFIDECIESFHVVMNKYKRRTGNRKGLKKAELLFKYNKEDTWLFDTLHHC